MAKSGSGVQKLWVSFFTKWKKKQTKKARVSLWPVNSILRVIEILKMKLAAYLL